MNLYGWIFFIAFFVWSFPLGVFRSRWRKMVYQTDSWWINIQPYFWRELKVLFGFIKLTKPEEVSMVKFFRMYLIVYFILFAGFIFFSSS